MESLDARLARKLATLRVERGWSLDALAERCGISRATLSRLERGETSPTAALLGRLCPAFGLSVSRLMAEVEEAPSILVPASAQTEWVDPETGFRRRMLSPPAPGFRGEMIEGVLPPGARIEYANPPLPGLEHHLWVLAGALEIEIDGTIYSVRQGDAIRFVISRASSYACLGEIPVRYVLAMWRP